MITERISSATEEMVPAYRLAAAKAVLAERERELLELKGPCSSRDRHGCPLHYAHAGPCVPRRGEGG